MRAIARELILGDSYIDCQRSREGGAPCVDVECHNLRGHCGVGHRYRQRTHGDLAPALVPENRNCVGCSCAWYGVEGQRELVSIVSSYESRPAYSRARPSAGLS